MGKWSWDRIAAGSGIVGVAGLLIGTFLPGSPPTVTDSRAKVIHYFVSHHRRGLVAEIIVGLGLLALIWFVGTISSAIRSKGQERLAAIALGGGIAAIGIAFIGTAINTALFYSVAHDTLLAKPLFVTSVVATTLIGFPAAALLFAVTIAVARSHMFPRWYVWPSGLAALALLFSGGAFAAKGFYSPTGGYSIISFIVFLVWAVVTALLLMTETRWTRLRRSLT
jgi:hypothetical protein